MVAVAPASYLGALLHRAPDAGPEHAADVMTTMGIALWQAGAIDRAIGLLDSVRLSPGGHGWEADLLAARGMVSMYAGRAGPALADLDRAIGLVHLWRPSTNQSRTYVLRSATRYVLGDWDGAAVDAAAARALAESQAEKWSGRAGDIDRRTSRSRSVGHRRGPSTPGR